MTVNQPSAVHEASGHDSDASSNSVRSRSPRASQVAAPSGGVGFPEVALLIFSVLALACLLVLYFSPWAPMTTVKHYAAIANCKGARLVGLSSAKRGEPGYWAWNDKDGNGVACERWRGILRVDRGEEVPVVEAQAEGGELPVVELQAEGGELPVVEVQADGGELPVVEAQAEAEGSELPLPSVAVPADAMAGWELRAN